MLDACHELWKQESVFIKDIHVLFAISDVRIQRPLASRIQWAEESHVPPIPKPELDVGNPGRAIAFILPDLEVLVRMTVIDLQVQLAAMHQQRQLSDAL